MAKNRLYKSLFSIGIGISSLIGLNTKAFCEEQPINPEKNQNVSISTSDTTSSAMPTKIIKGTVQKVDLELRTLQDIGIDLKSILRAASNLYDMATFQPVRIITQPEVIGAGTIINVPIGTEPTGPPRPITKESMDLAIKRMKPIVELLKKNVDEFVAGEKELNLPESVLNQLDPQLNSWVNLVNTISFQYRKLEQMADRPPYDNEKVAGLTASMQTNAKELERVRLSIYKVIQKAGKKINAHKRNDN